MVPPRVAALRRSVGKLDTARPTAHLAEVIEELAAHGQAVLSTRVWRITPEGGVLGDRDPGIDREIDRRSPWDRIVADCRDRALLAAEATDRAPQMVATPCWIDASDL